MGFYERYTKICAERKIDPCSNKTADMLGITRATISSWNTKGMTPKGETVAAIASALNVSSDYLLERTDDPTDYTRGVGLISSIKAGNEREEPEEIREAILLFSQLDQTDQAEIKGIMKGLLMQEKYKGKKQVS